MKLTIKENNYNFEITLNDTANNSEILYSIGTAICHIFLETISHYASSEEEAKEMATDILLHQDSIYEEFFLQGVFNVLHKQYEKEDLYRKMQEEFKEWISTTGLDLTYFKARYTDSTTFHLDIHSVTPETVTVTIADTHNRDSLFTYTKERLENAESFDAIALIDLMKLVVLGDELFDELNPIRSIMPKDYITDCMNALK